MRKKICKVIGVNGGKQDTSFLRMVIIWEKTMHFMCLHTLVKYIASVQEKKAVVFN